ncbi:MAG TPA: GNAT family N-acetyltransferase [candidate division Zixibacteria bacterium]|nr:GNAT family N-acetyltransferase [candidate division Zixibacteria bacterium]
MLNITTMTEDDIAFAVKMTDIERWGYLYTDFRKLMLFEPKGCFVAFKDDRPVGMVTTTSYDKYAFIGSLIVARGTRKEGIGEKLMQTAIDYLEGKGVTTIELDGVFAAASLYRRLGFKDKYLSLRFSREVSKEYGELFSCPRELEGEIVDFDRKAIGLNRARLLSAYFNEDGYSIYAIRENEIKAYILIRKRAGGVFAIGPLVASDQMYAETLLLSVLKKYGPRKLLTGVPAINRGMISLLIENGFIYNMPSLRMYRGPRVEYEENVYCIFSAEKG